MRLIDGDALRDKLLELASDDWNQMCRTFWANVYNECADMVDNQPIIEPQKWIPCSERLPKERDSIFAKLYGTEKWRNAMFRRTSNTVIITVKFKDGTRQTAPCHTIDGEWNQSMKGMGKVLAWMPLPEPYKGEEE